jgi:CRP-like cAMP-binding protein
MNATANLILAALPEDEREHLLQVMQRIVLKTGQVLYEQDAPVSTVYFPLAGAVSVLILLENGRAMEPAIVGREGMLGYPLGLGENRSPWQSVVQLPGEGLSMSRDQLQDVLVRPGHLGPLLTHYAGLLMGFTAQSAACAQFHRLEERTARWLLIMRDRAGTDEFAVTQEWLAHMLGVYRPNETVALGALRDQGLIGLERGKIHVRDVAGLEASACECYARSASQFAELVHASPSSRAARKGYPHGT